MIDGFLPKTTGLALKATFWEGQRSYVNDPLHKTVSMLLDLEIESAPRWGNDFPVTVHRDRPDPLESRWGTVTFPRQS